MALFQENNYLNSIESCLNKVLSNPKTDPYLLQAMRYSVLGGGKRIRPLLAISSSKLSQARIDKAISVGCFIELIHCYSLVHDDLPAMDNDDLRRGQPTCHKQYNEATAILVGDALQTLAFEELSSDQLDIKPDNKLKIIHLISQASGMNGMVGGQVIDLISTGKKLTLEQLKHMHALKTGALIKASVLSGYLCGENFSVEIYKKLEEISSHLGLLFQVVDDILDVTESSNTLGKTANKDAQHNKATYVSLFGLDGANQVASDLYQNIIASLKLINNSSMLQELSTSIYKRNH